MTPLRLIAAAGVLGLGGCIHVLENGLTGKQAAAQPPPIVYGPPDSLANPPRSTPPASDPIWRDPNVQIGIFGLIVAVGNHFSKKSAANLTKGKAGER